MTSYKSCKQEEGGLRYLNCWEKKKHQHKILYPKKLSFKSKGGIEALSDQQKIEGMCYQ